MPEPRSWCLPAAAVLLANVALADSDIDVTRNHVMRLTALSAVPRRALQLAPLWACRLSMCSPAILAVSAHVS